MGSEMKLTETPDTVNWPATYYVYIEKKGPFQETAMKAWKEFHENIDELLKQVKITGYTSFYKVKPEMIYRAGATIDAKPAVLPAGYQVTQFQGGKYSRFIMTGPYKNLPEACGKVFEIVEKTKMPVRDDFFIENYVNDPRVTPEEQLITEIQIPTV
ncbi:GyrI-like domain-containing protein [Bdellovibrio reynosensis]|uniref:GyrI-like domain-containing protein n=1 Tax=Bdellovibrio reynosensis TaxID=2835041 RepID=A0ABY4C6P3_9BACT|nr:GyrI-like domain-containing protein [Bdellovibrio reynosensis]UOF00636.1 GyrI-like domain-containing protein [Bdellovibrio reynosensis]